MKGVHRGSPCSSPRTLSVVGINLEPARSGLQIQYAKLLAKLPPLVSDYFRVLPTSTHVSVSR